MPRSITAAEQRYPPAQMLLGSMYFRGDGVLQDYVQAHMWTNLAAAQGDNEARRNLDSLSEKMTPADVSKAQLLARKWIKKHEKGESK